MQPQHKLWGSAFGVSYLVSYIVRAKVFFRIFIFLNIFVKLKQRCICNCINKTKPFHWARIALIRYPMKSCRLMSIETTQMFLPEMSAFLIWRSYGVCHSNNMFTYNTALIHVLFCTLFILTLFDTDLLLAVIATIFTALLLLQTFYKNVSWNYNSDSGRQWNAWNTPSLMHMCLLHFKQGAYTTVAALRRWPIPHGRW